MSSIETLSAVKRSDDGAIPLWFTSGQDQIFAWYHPARGQQHSKAVVLCNTFGSEAMLAHPAYRQLAMDLANAGFPCLRFDYPGTGDSSGSPRDKNLLSRWFDSIHQSIDCLRQYSGAQSVALFGILLGATLAAQVASEREDVDDLILWAPFLNGKNFLRTIKLQESVITANKEGIRSSDWQEGDSEAFGFLIAKEFAADLQKLEINKISQAPCKRACVFVQDLASNEKKLVSVYKSLGVVVDFIEQPVNDISLILGDMLPAAEINNRVVYWLQANASIMPEFHDSIAPLVNNQSVTFKNVNGNDCSEEPVFLTGDVKVFGILTRPNTIANTNGVSVLLLNGGHNHRVGINRNYTEWARDWSAQGYTVLRLDICGLGDSPTRETLAPSRLYLDSTLQDVEVACDHLMSLSGLQKLVVIGLCGGAYQAYRYAVQSNKLSNIQKLNGIILINPLRFQSPVYGIDGLSVQGCIEQLIADMSLWAYCVHFLNFKNWPEIFRHRRASFRLVKNALLQCLNYCTFNFFGRRKGGLRQELDVTARELCSLTERNVHVMILCSSAEDTLPFFKPALARYLARLQKSRFFSMRIMQNTNHIFSPLWSQQEAYQLLLADLDLIRQSEKN